MAAQVLMAWATAICLLLGIWSAPAVLAGLHLDGSKEAAMNDTTELCYDTTVDRQRASWLSELLQDLLDRLSGFHGTTACAMNTLAFGKKQSGAPHSAFAIKHDSGLQRKVASLDVVSGSAVSKSDDLSSESLAKYDTQALAYISCPSKQVPSVVDSETSASFKTALDTFRSSQRLATLRKGSSKATAQRAYLGFNYRATCCL